MADTMRDLPGCAEAIKDTAQVALLLGSFPIVAHLDGQSPNWMPTYSKRNGIVAPASNCSRRQTVPCELRSRLAYILDFLP
jgi:hypothetical protein